MSLTCLSILRKILNFKFERFLFCLLITLRVNIFFKFDFYHYQYLSSITGTASSALLTCLQKKMSKISFGVKNIYFTLLSISVTVTLYSLQSGSCVGEYCLCI